MTMSSREFYRRGLGDAFLDPRYYSREIAEYLSQEKLILGSHAANFDLLIEVGCMGGRYLSWALHYDKAYMGIDIVSKYVEDGRRKVAESGLSPQRYRFRLGCAEELSEILPIERQTGGAYRCLILFPFNSFGNVQDVQRVVASVRQTRMPFLISSYATSEEATLARVRYYRRCGYANVCVVGDERGVCVSASCGLASIAYRAEYLRALCDREDLPIKVEEFGWMGVAYMNDGLFPTSNPPRSPTDQMKTDAAPVPLDFQLDGNSFRE